MGNIAGKVLEKNQKFMQETQQMQMERQIQMQNLMRERLMAMQLARLREMFMWLFSFYCIALPAGVGSYVKTKKPFGLIPLLPLTFVVAYQYDAAYGTKMDRIRQMADHIILEEASLLAMPQGVPSVSEIDARRQQPS